MPDAVHQHAHVHAARAPPRPGFGKGRAHLAGIEDVSSQKNVVPRRRDGLQHGRIGLVAVVQGTERIAAAEVLVRQAAASNAPCGQSFSGTCSGGRTGQGGWAYSGSRAACCRMILSARLSARLMPKSA